MSSQSSTTKQEEKFTVEPLPSDSFAVSDDEPTHVTRTPTTVGLITHKAMFDHVCDATCEEVRERLEMPEHPERSERLTAVLDAFKGLNVTQLTPRLATDAELGKSQFVQNIIRQIGLIVKDLEAFDSDADMYAVAEKTELAARYAAGCSIQLVEDIIAGNVESGFAAIRPPGHHSHHDKVAGFCFFNNAMHAAVRATELGKRVLIIDLDVHVGDGVIDIMKTKQKNNTNIAYVTIHRYDNGTFYPGKDKEPSQVGAPGLFVDHRVKSIAYNDGARGDRYYKAQMRDAVLPFAQSFKPDLIIVCAGFDAAQGDKMGRSEVTPRGYAEMIRQIQTVSRNIAMILEGGYNLNALTASVRACVKVLLQPPPEEAPGSVAAVAATAAETTTETTTKLATEKRVAPTMLSSVPLYEAQRREEFLGKVAALRKEKAAAAAAAEKKRERERKKEANRKVAAAAAENELEKQQMKKEKRDAQRNAAEEARAEQDAQPAESASTVSMLTPVQTRSYEKNVQDAFDAVERGDYQTLIEMFDEGIDVGHMFGPIDRMTPLMAAAAANQFETVRQLILLGSNVNMLDDKGQTALFYAVRHGHNPIAALLVDHGARIGIADSQGKTVLQVAEKGGKNSLINYLRRNIEPNTIMRDAFNAAASGDNAKLQQIHDDGTDITTIVGDIDHTTLLMAAAASNQLETVRKLIDMGSHVNTTDDKRQTALFHAVLHGHTDVAAFLISRGARVHLRNIAGETVLRIAEKGSNKSLIALLRGKLHPRK